MNMYTSSPGPADMINGTLSTVGNFSILNSGNNTNNTNNTTAPRAVSRWVVELLYPIIIAEMVLSIVCLILIIFVYSVLPGHRNVHGKNLITLSSCLISAFVFLTLDRLYRKHLPPPVCQAFGLVTHFSFLGNFFWTNVVAFDICKTMTDLKPKSEGGGSGKYRRYSIYAWTATTLTVLPAIVLDNTKWLPKEYRPNFATRRCWLNSTRSFVLYFNAPVGVLLLSNLIMFFITVWSMIKIKKMTDKMHIKQQRKRFNLYVKILLVVGVIWLTEFLPWATNNYNMYALAGIMTAAHGVLLFIIFVCKKRIINQLCKRYNFKFRFHEQKSTTTNESTSSQPSNLNSSRV